MEIKINTNSNNHDKEAERKQKDRRKYERYLENRKSYTAEKADVSNRYDNWILTLSGGALGLSITFIEKIVKEPLGSTRLWLMISWGFLICALLSALASLVTSQSAYKENIKELDNAVREKRDPHLEIKKWYTNITKNLNWISLILFICGLIFLCVFSFLNINSIPIKERLKNDTETPTTPEKHSIPDDPTITVS